MKFRCVRPGGVGGVLSAMPPAESDANTNAESQSIPQSHPDNYQSTHQLSTAATTETKTHPSPVAKFSYPANKATTNSQKSTSENFPNPLPDKCESAALYPCKSQKHECHHRSCKNRESPSGNYQ